MDGWMDVLGGTNQTFAALTSSGLRRRQPNRFRFLDRVCACVCVCCCCRAAAVRACAHLSLCIVVAVRSRALSLFSFVGPSLSPPPALSVCFLTVQLPDYHNIVCGAR